MTIFPGMDPYLDDPHLWPGVHSSMVVYIRDHLQPLLRPRYIATIEERVFVETPPGEIIPDVPVKQGRPPDERGGTAVLVEVEIEADAPVVVRAPELEIHESYVAIVDKQTGQGVVTVIEVVSPTNKNAGPGRDSYLDKQREGRASQAHLVELDLLRAGRHVLAVPEGLARRRCAYDYLVCVNRAGSTRNTFELYPSRLRDRLPRVRIPLASGDRDVPLDVQAVLARTYQAGLYRELLRYPEPCAPPLSPEDQAWAAERVRESAKNVATEDTEKTEIQRIKID